MSCDVQVVLIAAGVVAYWRRRAVDAGEEEEGGFLLRTILKANRYGGLVLGSWTGLLVGLRGRGGDGLLWC